MDTKEYACLLPYNKEYKIDLYKNPDGKYMGYAQLIDIMPRMVPKGRTGDVALVQGARISYGSSNLRSEKADKGLVEYLVEHYHTSPLELASVKFIIKAPLFVFNQLVRHRTACITGDCNLIFGFTDRKQYYEKSIKNDKYLVFEMF